MKVIVKQLLNVEMMRIDQKARLIADRISYLEFGGDPDTYETSETYKRITTQIAEFETEADKLKAKIEALKVQLQLQ